MTGDPAPRPPSPSLFTLPETDAGVSTVSARGRGGRGPRPPPRVSRATGEGSNPRLLPCPDPDIVTPSKVDAKAAVSPLPPEGDASAGARDRAGRCRYRSPGERAAVPTTERRADGKTRRASHGPPLMARGGYLRRADLNSSFCLSVRLIGWLVGLLSVSRVGFQCRVGLLTPPWPHFSRK